MARFLIIEDNEDNMVLISFILEKNGHETICAYTGEDGLEMATRTRPDAVLIDIQLPDIDGFELLRRLRENPETRDIPVVAVTSYAMAGDRELLLNAGCSGYIEKPIDPEKIMAQLLHAIDKM